MNFYTRNEGVFPVIQTPFLENDEICYSTLEKEVHFLIDAKVNGIVVGMVTEINRFTEPERKEFLNHLIRFVDHQLPVVMSVGGESLKQVEFRACEAEQLGASAFMAIPPLSFRCDDIRLWSYYQKILDSSTVPLILQDASGYLGNPVSPDLMIKLYQANPGRVMFKPEAPPVGKTISLLSKETNGKGSIYEGTGGKGLTEAFLRGACGSIPGSAIPWADVELWKCLKNGDQEKALQLQSLITLLMAPLQSLDSYLAVEKFLLYEQGIFNNERIRPPGYYDLDGFSRQGILKIVDQLGNLCGKNNGTWREKK